MRQQEIILTAVNNIARVTLQQECTRLIGMNNTSNDVYFNHSSFLPSASTKDGVIKAASNGFPGNIAIPQKGVEYCFFLPTSPALTDTTQICTIILYLEDVPTQRFREVLLDAVNLKKKYR